LADYEGIALRAGGAIVLGLDRRIHRKLLKTMTYRILSNFVSKFRFCWTRGFVADRRTLSKLANWLATVLNLRHRIEFELVREFGS
jgi:hypothetical protein